MKKLVAGRQKRAGGDQEHNKPLFAYVNEEENDMIDRACDLVRRSKSSFIADAALKNADEVLRAYKRGIAEESRRIEHERGSSK
jgi:uncharacterized protein (DUF1778 family)